MKNLIAVACLLSVVAVAADRVTTETEASVKVYRTELNTLSDGGCSVKAYALVTKSDGGVVGEGSREVEVAGANRTSCLDIQTKALVLFKSTNGF